MIWIISLIHTHRHTNTHTHRHANTHILPKYIFPDAQKHTHANTIYIYVLFGLISILLWVKLT